MADGQKSFEWTPSLVPTSLPSWFCVGKNTPVIHTQRVRRGRHPLGGELGPEESSCRTCKFVEIKQMSKRYFKCGLMEGRWTSGKATDVTLRWRGCSAWEMDIE